MQMCIRDRYCEEAGAEVTMVNLKDYHIESCTGCTSCTRGMAQGKNVGCVLDAKDDKKKIMEVMLAQDAVIFSAPTYDLMPNAEYLIFAQRSLSYETAFLETIGAIEHKDRVAGLICAGGSTRAWQSMACLLYTSSSSGRKSSILPRKVFPCFW